MTQDEIDAVYNILLQEFKDNPAPVIDLMAAQGAEPYKILIATILSARTKDSTTSDVVRNKLFRSSRDRTGLRLCPYASDIHPDRREKCIRRITM